jgi:NADH dehydrogenase
VILIEAGQRVLSSFDERLSARARRDLEQLGVHVWTGTRVTGVRENEVELGKEVLRASTILWAAGIEPSSLARTLGTPLDPTGRPKVNPDLSLPDNPEVFVVGDLASFTEASGRVLPQLAPVANQQGRHAARNILRLAGGGSSEPFQYFDKGQMATIGKSRAILQWHRIRMSGMLAWLAWLFVHIYYLIGFRNRLIVLYSWAWSYFTHRRGARLILYKDWRSSAR